MKVDERRAQIDCEVQVLPKQRVTILSQRVRLPLTVKRQPDPSRLRPVPYRASMRLIQVVSVPARLWLFIREPFEGRKMQGNGVIKRFARVGGPTGGLVADEQHAQLH